MVTASNKIPGCTTDADDDDCGAYGSDDVPRTSATDKGVN